MGHVIKKNGATVAPATDFKAAKKGRVKAKISNNNDPSAPGQPKIVPVIDLKGVIAAGGPNLNIDNCRQVIDAVFNVKGAVAVALDINCPGGSPAQSELIANHIRKRAQEKGLPVYAFTQDVAASGGYWLACAADEIYAGKTSILGSIGVITSHISDHKKMEREGLEYREFTAGESKSGLHPHKKATDKDIKETKERLNEIHKIFIDWVKSRRGNRLQTQDKELFTGKTWHGEKAVSLGLIDGIGEMEDVLEKKFGKNVQMAKVVRSSSQLGRSFNGAAEGGKGKGREPGADMFEDTSIDKTEKRLIWKRFGL